jgi:hypothetical protein
MSSGSEKGMPKALKGIKSKPSKMPSRGSSNKSSPLGNFLFLIFFLLIGSVVYLEVAGIPDFLRGVIPQSIVNLLGLGGEETVVAQKLREAGAPKLTAHGTRSDDPTIPINGSVEEIVKTMRPDIYFKDKIPKEYVDHSLSNRIPYQNRAFHYMLSTFYKATPDDEGIGYLDLAYQAPNFYFARVIALDARTRNFYREQLRTKVITFTETDSVTSKDGSVEFCVHGGFQKPEFKELKPMQLVQPSRVRTEIMALRSLAALKQIRLSGIENPIEENFETYRRVIIKTTTEADYPTLLSFADALQNSDIAFGVQQFVSRPTSPDKIQSSLEFVLYAAVN